MPLTAVLVDFDRLRGMRRSDPFGSLRLVGNIAKGVLEVLAELCDRHPFTWRGRGEKEYEAFALRGATIPFSRGINSQLFIHDVAEWEALWAEYIDGLTAAQTRGDRLILGVEGGLVDRAAYTAVVGFGAATDLFGAGNRGGPGSFFEMVVGPTLSILTGRGEQGGPRLTVPDTDRVEIIPIDLSYPTSADTEVNLAVPTKISTRERISQAYVHQRMLDVLAPGSWRSILCIANENNRMGPPRAVAESKTVDNCWLVDTTVAETIAQYERYTSHLSGLYYLDPPDAYINSGTRGLPPVRHFYQLVCGDLHELLPL